MSKAVYLFDSNAKLIKKGSLTYDEDTLKYTFSLTEAYITQGNIEVDELCIVVPDAMLNKDNAGVFGSFVSPVRNPLGLIPGDWETRTIIDGAVETTYLNCAIFPLEVAYYTYVAGRYGFAIGFVDSTTGAIQKTPYDSYVVQNGVDNFTENNLTPSDYDNLLTAITNLTSTLGGGLSTAQDDINTLEATVIILEADKHEHSALVGTAAEIAAGIDKNTKVYTKLKVEEVVAANGVDDKAYTDTEVAKIVGGTYIADKATKDADGNVISATYEKVANKKTTLNDNSDDYYPTQKAVKTAVDLKLSKDLSSLTDGGQIASNDLIYVYTNDGVPTKVAGSELTQLIKTITMNTSTYVLTITKYDGTQTTIDLPAEMAFVSASYSDVTQDLTFTLQNGTTVAVPLDDLVGGLASEDWVALNYVAKTQIVNDLTTGGATDVLSAEQGKALQDTKEALTNKATDFSTVNDTKYPSVKAVDDRIKPIELDIADHSQLIAVAQIGLATHEQRLDETEETLRKALNSDGTSTADDDGTGIIAMGKDVAPAPLKVLVEGLLLDAPQLVTNGVFDTNITGWNASNIGTPSVVGGVLIFTATAQNGFLYQELSVIANHTYYIVSRFKANSSDVTVSLTDNVSSAVSIYHSGGGAFEIKSAIEDIANTTSGAYLYIQDQRAITWAEIQVDFVYLYDITNLITNKQYSPLFSTTFDLMSDAQIKLQMDAWVIDGTLPNDISGADMNLRLRATGKNLFDGVFTSQTIGSTYTRLSENQFSIKGLTATGSNSVNLFPNIKYKQVTQYTISGSVIQDVAGTNTRLRVLYTDGTLADIFVPTTSLATFSLTSTIGKTIQAIVVNYSSPNGTTTVTNLQLELGEVATTYEPCKHSDLYLQSNEVGYSYQATKDSIEFRDGKFYFIKRINATLDGLLATPVTTEIASSGILNGYPSGHIYIDNYMIKDIALYGTSASVTNTDCAITSLDYIYNVTTKSYLAVSGATIASGGLSFTHAGITAGDFVIFAYKYGSGLRGLTTVTYYDNPLIVAGSGTTAGKVYKIVPTVVDADIVWTKVEV